MGGHRKKKNQKKNFSKKKKRDKNFHFCLFRQGKRNAVEPCFFFRTLGAGNGRALKKEQEGAGDLQYAVRGRFQPARRCGRPERTPERKTEQKKVYRCRVCGGSSLGCGCDVRICGPRKLKCSKVCWRMQYV